MDGQRACMRETLYMGMEKLIDTGPISRRTLDERSCVRVIRMRSAASLPPAILRNVHVTTFCASSNSACRTKIRIHSLQTLRNLADTDIRCRIPVLPRGVLTAIEQQCEAVIYD